VHCRTPVAVPTGTYPGPLAERTDDRLVHGGARGGGAAGRMLNGSDD